MEEYTMPRRFRSKRPARRPRRKSMGTKSRKAKVSRPLRRAIVAVSRSQQETKYVAEYLVGSAGPLGVLAGTAAVPACLQRVLPTLSQGTTDAERIGEKVSPIRAKLQITVHFQATPTGGTAGAYSDCDVHVLVLAVKSARNAAAVATTPAGTLLKNGIGGNFDPLVGSVSQTNFLENVNHCPVNTEQFTVLRRFKHRFAKGDYDINGPAAGSGGTQKSMSSPCHTFEYSWVPPRLDFNSSLDTFPTNYYPVYVLWCTALDGGPYSGNIYYGARSEMYFKDA